VGALNDHHIHTRQAVICAARPSATAAARHAATRAGIHWTLTPLRHGAPLPWGAIAEADLAFVQGSADQLRPFLEAWSRRTIHTKLAVQCADATAQLVVQALHAGVVDVLLDPPSEHRVTQALGRAGLVAKAGVPLAELVASTDYRSLSLFRSLGVSIREVEDQLADPEARPADIVATVSRDPALVEGILQAANSPAWGSRSVKTLREAFVRLGLSQLGMVARQVLVADAYQLDDPGLADLASAMWGNAVATAAGARALARHVRLDPVVAGNAALLHNIGKVAILGLVASHEVAERGSRRWRNLLVDQIITHHGRAGAEVLRGMGMSGLEAALAEHHHRPPALEGLGIDRRYGHLINLCWEYAHTLGFRYPRRDHTFRFDDECRALQVSPRQVRPLLQRAMLGDGVRA